MCSSQVYEWRRARDAGVLTGLKPGARIGKLTPDQAEIARLRRELDVATRRFAPAVVALEIIEKAHMLLESLSKSTCAAATRGASMSVYRELVAVSVPVRRAAALTGVSRASASYRPRSATRAPRESVRSVPVNKLTADERQQVLGC